MTFGLYCLLPGIRAKNFLLILASLVFYAFGEPFYVIVMALSAAANYLFGLYASRKGLTGRISIFLAVIFNLSVISIFKYADFAVEVANRILLTEFPQPGIPLPVGISFFTFQALSYVIDAYREEGAAASGSATYFCTSVFFRSWLQGRSLSIVTYKASCPSAAWTAKKLRRESDVLSAGFLRSCSLQTPWEAPRMLYLRCKR